MSHDFVSPVKVFTTINRIERCISTWEHTPGIIAETAVEKFLPAASAIVENNEPPEFRREALGRMLDELVEHISDEMHHARVNFPGISENWEALEARLHAMHITGSVPPSGQTPRDRATEVARRLVEGIIESKWLVSARQFGFAEAIGFGDVA